MLVFLVARRKQHKQCILIVLFHIITHPTKREHIKRRHIVCLTRLHGPTGVRLCLCVFSKHLIAHHCVCQCGRALGEPLSQCNNRALALAQFILNEMNFFDEKKVP